MIALEKRVLITYMKSESLGKPAYLHSPEEQIRRVFEHN